MQIKKAKMAGRCCVHTATMFCSVSPTVYCIVWALELRLYILDLPAYGKSSCDPVSPSVTLRKFRRPRGP